MKSGLRLNLKVASFFAFILKAGIIFSPISFSHTVSPPPTNKNTRGEGWEGHLSEKQLSDYQQQGCSNVFMSLTHKWGSALDKIGVHRNPHAGRLLRKQTSLHMEKQQY